MKAIIEFSSLQDFTGLGNPTEVQAALEAIVAELAPLLGNPSSFRNGFVITVSNGAYLQIQMTDGTIGYTTGENFNLNAQGQIVDSNNNLLLPNITAPQDAYTLNIDGTGTVTCSEAGQTQTTQLGQIQIASFANPVGLTTNINGYLVATANSGAPIVGTAETGSFANNAINYIASQITVQGIQAIVQSATNDLNAVIAGI